jgi:hypothetical protein
MNNQSPMPSIKEIIFQAFGVTLPIRGELHLAVVGKRIFGILLNY